MFNRIISLESILSRKSVFLFGPRQTGKSTWLMAQYPNALYVNLLRKKAFDFFSNTHDALESEITIFCNKIETSSTSDTDSTGNATNTIIVITRSGT